MTCRTRRPDTTTNSEDDVASYLLNLTNLDHVVDRADAVLDRAEDKLAAWTPWAHEKYEGAAEATGAAARRFRAFALLLVTSLVMFGLAFTLGLPILVIRPQKFALAFTTGSIFFARRSRWCGAWGPSCGVS